MGRKGTDTYPGFENRKNDNRYLVFVHDIESFIRFIGIAVMGQMVVSCSFSALLSFGSLLFGLDCAE